MISIGDSAKVFMRGHKLSRGAVGGSSRGTICCYMGTRSTCLEKMVMQHLSQECRSLRKVLRPPRVNDRFTGADEGRDIYRVSLCGSERPQFQSSAIDELAY